MAEEARDHSLLSQHSRLILRGNGSGNRVKWPVFSLYTPSKNISGALRRAEWNLWTLKRMGMKAVPQELLTLQELLSPFSTWPNVRWDSHKRPPRSIRHLTDLPRRSATAEVNIPTHAFFPSNISNPYTRRGSRTSAPDVAQGWHCSCISYERRPLSDNVCS